jgi:hypothetical protein
MKLETYILQIKRTDQWRNTEHSSVSISDLKNYCEPGIPHRIIRQKDKLIVWRWRKRRSGICWLSIRRAFLFSSLYPHPRLN